VFFGWAAMLFTPWLILFTAADTISSEVASRAIRYTALRTSRLAYALGKAIGQAGIILGVTALSAVAFFVVAWMTFDVFDAGATAAGLASYWPRVVLYCLPFLAWAMLSSMATSSTNLARILALGGAVGLAIVNAIAQSPKWRGRSDVGDGFLDILTHLTPFGHREGFFYPPGGAFTSDLALCLALTVVYFSAGFAILRRRDL
jgi:ABC-type transport system involved in multi-copper enzyme maturation permease subunit